jgi:hypothetical protein
MCSSKALPRCARISPTPTERSIVVGTPQPVAVIGADLVGDRCVGRTALP